MPTSDPRRLVAACNHITAILIHDYPDLNPAEHAFILNHLVWTHHFSFHTAAEADSALRAASKGENH